MEDNDENPAETPMNVDHVDMSDRDTNVDTGSIDAGEAMAARSSQSQPATEEPAFDDEIDFAGPTEDPESQPEPDTDGTDEFDQITDTQAIDWQALWEEFGFDTPDVTGGYVISETQLIGAVEASEQDITGTAREHINNAVESEDLLDVFGGYKLQVMFA